MPELPEVEVTKRGIEPYLKDAVITDVYFDDKKLREPFNSNLYNLVDGEVLSVERRAKYILIHTSKGTLLLHLGMTGHLRIISDGREREIHDHFEFSLDNGHTIRLNDTRRFGLVLYFAPNENPFDSPYLNALGPEPLGDEFSSEYLYNALHKKKKAIKQALMDASVVVGVGNIYASEVLFASHISPLRLANTVTKKECDLLTKCIIATLKESISKGGTTIRDFSGADGKMGYFVQNLFVYGHAGEQCKVCGTKIETLVQGQRSTFYCPHCQK